ncbi:MAG: bacterial Ig-like domain-containing protein, partial [Bacteroidales bacterium]|nr:bacterial Ig-like domain-containing protein [Bacteroidales bacterium]
GNTYTVQSVASENFISWSSGNSATLSNDGLKFTITKNDDGTYLLNKGDRYLSLNSSTGSNYFAMYTGTQSQNLYLIKAVEGEEAVPELTGITVNATKTTFTVGDEFEFAGTVTANYSNGTTKDVTASATFSGYDKSKQGTQTITVTYEGKTATYAITVNPVQSGGEDLKVAIINVTNVNAAKTMGNGAYGDYKDKAVSIIVDGLPCIAQNICANSKDGTLKMAATQFIQVKSSTGLLYNTGGNVKSIKVWTHPTKDKGDFIYVGSSQAPTAKATMSKTTEFVQLKDDKNKTVSTELNVYEVEFEPENSYFNFKSSGAIWIYKVEVTYSN